MISWCYNLERLAKLSDMTVINTKQSGLSLNADDDGNCACSAQMRHLLR